MAVFLKAVFGAQKLDAMELPAIKREISTLLYIDPAIVDEAIKTVEEATRVARKTRSAIRKMLTTGATAAFFASTSFFAQGSVEEFIDMKTRERVPELQSIPREHIVNPEIVQSYRRDNMQNFIDLLGIKLAFWMVAAGSGLAAGVFANRRFMLRGDIKQMAEMTQNREIIDGLRSLAKTETKVAPTGLG